ncbi:MAG TPA: hypothetical protein VMG40_17220 [Bryobacteraceae bacterium]|nr:hypothetical protein [Bryobacteraceae bacterium]
MAALANVYNRLFDREGQQIRGGARKTEESTRVRAFANEDIYFYIKRIDNSGVVREADPKARGVCWKLIGSAGAAVILLIAVLLPSAYSLLAGYQIQSLKQEQARLADEQATLELQETQLVSPARMEQLAKEQQFIDPPAQKVVYLNQGGAVAMNTEIAGK